MAGKRVPEKTQTVKSHSEPPPSGFAARVEAARKAAGLTKVELEHRAELASGYASRITRGQQGATRPTDDLIRRLSRALSVDPHWLATGEGPPSEARRVLLLPNLERAGRAMGADVSENTVDEARQALGAYGDLEFSTWISVLTDLERLRRKSET